MRNTAFKNIIIDHNYFSSYLLHLKMISSASEWYNEFEKFRDCYVYYWTIFYDKV